jgi:hypothetical protein
MSHYYEERAEYLERLRREKEERAKDDDKPRKG